MIYWILFFTIIVSALIVSYQVVPVEHQRNYQECPKNGAYWFAALCSVSIPITAVVQSLVAPSDFPVWLRVIGGLYMFAGYALQVWAWRINYFLIPSVVYIPPEFRATTGPYRFLRHPYYYGAGSAAVGSVFLLGQWWALFPFGAYQFLLFYRIAIEDRILSGRRSI